MYKGHGKKTDAGFIDAQGSIFTGRIFVVFRAKLWYDETKNVDPASSDAQALVKRLQGYITENYYPCTKEILNSLGEMYAAGGEFTENIDKAGGEGTAVFAQRAIAIYCR